MRHLLQVSIMYTINYWYIPIIGKGSNVVVSLLQHYLQYHSLEEQHLHLHADNCIGQNKNNVVIQVNPTISNFWTSNLRWYIIIIVSINIIVPDMESSRWPEWDCNIVISPSWPYQVCPTGVLECWNRGTVEL